MCFLLIGATFAAYLPAMRGGLLWDDDAHVTRPELRSVHGLWRIWFEPGATQQYYPVLHSAFWVEHRVWGGATFGYHLLNVLLHGIAACLLALALRKLGLGRDPQPPASDLARRGMDLRPATQVDVPWLAAWIFALHPVCVESVAWISEQKNTLSTVFYLLAALAYLEWRGDGADARARKPVRHYWLATGLFALALLSKSVTATLPAALLVVFWWKDGRLSWKRDVAPLLPWFAMGASAGLCTAWIERRLIGAEGAGYALGFLQRCLLAGRDLWFYLGKLFWPAHLIFIYPRWSVETAAAREYLYPIGFLVLAAALWLLRRRSRGPLAGLLFFAGSLFPALGFFNVYPFIYSYVADHFQYVATFGIISVAAGGWGLWDAWAVKRDRDAAARGLANGGFVRGPLLTAVAAVCMLGALTWRQCRAYRDPETLFRATLGRNPGGWMAHTNLGVILVREGRSGDGIAQFEEALRLNPDDAEAHFNLAIGLARLPGRMPEAIAHYERALRLRPNFAEAHYNLANELARIPGRTADAISHYEEALRLKPDAAAGHFQLAGLLALAGHQAAAIAHYEAALRLDPDFAEAHYRLAGELARLPGRMPEAIAHYGEELRLRPDDALGHYKLASLFAQAGRVPEALGHYEQALRLRPGFAEARARIAELENPKASPK